MRFPRQPGAIASVTLAVKSLADTAAFWRGVLRPLGYGRINAWPGHVLWAREGAQLLLQEAPDAPSRVLVMLRARTRADVDAIHAAASTNAWPVREPPREQPVAPGYYGCVLAVPGSPDIRLAIAHAWDDLPAYPGAEPVQIAGADPDVTLGGYLFRAAPPTPRPAIIVLPGYGGDATHTAAIGERLRDAGFTALCLSQRGWLGSTGSEDQGLRQPDDVVCAAEWLGRHSGSTDVALLSFSQGGQVALLAATRGARFAAIVAYFPCTDLETWPAQSGNPSIADYLDDFVDPADIARCSPARLAACIAAPTLLIHGDRDTNVPIAQSEAMVVANPAIRLRVVPGAQHWFTRAQWDEVWPEVVSFLGQSRL